MDCDIFSKFYICDFICQAVLVIKRKILIKTEQNYYFFKYYLSRIEWCQLMLDQTQIKRTSNRFKLDRSNFELPWTQVHPLKPNFKPTRTPSKKPELRTCSTRNGPNPGPNLEKQNFEPFQTQVRQPKSTYKFTRTLQKSQTLNPQTGSWTKFLIFHQSAAR